MCTRFWPTPFPLGAGDPVPEARGPTPGVRGLTLLVSGNTPEFSRPHAPLLRLWWQLRYSPCLWPVLHHHFFQHGILDLFSHCSPHHLFYHSLRNLLSICNLNLTPGKTCCSCSTSLVHTSVSRTFDHRNAVKFRDLQSCAMRQ